MLRQISTVFVTAVACGTLFFALGSLSPSGQGGAQPAQIPYPGVFLWGDSNCDGSVDIADPVMTLSYLFSNGPIPTACAQSTPLEVTVVDPVVVTSVLPPAQNPANFHSFSGTGGLAPSTALVLTPSAPGANGFIVTDILGFGDTSRALMKSRLENQIGDLKAVMVLHTIGSANGTNNQDHPAPASFHFETGIRFAAGDQIVFKHTESGSVDVSITVLGYEF